jgi:hypothetical protein
VCLTARSCHKSTIIKLLVKKKKQRKKTNSKKKTNEEKEKKYELTVLTLQIRLTRHTLNLHRESLIIKKEKTN